MTGYRVPDDPEDPLAVDEALCAQTREKELRVFQGLITVLTIGFWLPGFLIWLGLSADRRRKFASGYRVRIRDGVLTAGNRSHSRSVPLDAIADASVLEGKVTVSVVGGNALVIYGLRDPEAAVHRILQARRSYVAGVQSGGADRARVAVEDSSGHEAFIGDERGAAGRRRS